MMIIGREVSKDSAISTTSDFSTVFEWILSMWTSLQNDQNLTLVFICQHDLIKAFNFQTTNENGE